MLTRGAETCAKRKSTSLCLLAIPAFDRIAGFCNKNHISKGDYANDNDYGVRLKTLTDLARNESLVSPGLILGGINFGRLVGCLSSEPRIAQSQTWRYATFIRRLGEAVTPVREVCPDFAS